MLQLDPTIPMDTPKGPGHAHFLIDMGQEHHLLWVVFLDESGECWTFKNPDIRLQANPTMGIRTRREGVIQDAGKKRSTAESLECQVWSCVGQKAPLRQ